MTETATLYSTTLPLSFYGLHGGRSKPRADTSNSAASFVDWLFNSASTELGPFPDWPYLRDFATRLASGEDLIVLKRRQILISWVVAAFQHWTASRNPYHHCAVVSAEGRAARKQGRRIVIVARRDGYDVQGVDLIKYPNGSEITILPSTEHAGVGESIKVMHYDEFAFHPYGAENMAAIQPAVSNSNGQTIITSTSNPEMGAAGPFYDMWDATPEGDGKLFYGRYVRPDQHSGSEFWAKEQARPINAGKNFDAYYPINPEDAFIARVGLVYELDREKTIRRAEVPWESCSWRVVGIDLGGGDGDPTAIVPLGVSRLTSIVQPPEGAIEGLTALQVHAHQYGEYVKAHGCGLAEIDRYLKSLGGPRAIDIVSVAETGGETVTTSLRALGYNAFVHKARRSDIDTHIRWWLDSGLCTIEPDCDVSIREFGVYRWKRARNQIGESYETSTPDWTHGDCMDARRAGLMAILRGLPTAMSSGRVNVNYSARKSVPVRVR